MQPFDAAFLRAGPRAALVLALGDLEHAGAVVLEPGSRRYRVGKAPLSGSLHPLPRAVHAAVRRGAETAADIWRDTAVVAVFDAMGGELERRGLVRRGGGGAKLGAIALIVASIAGFAYGGASGNMAGLMIGLMCFFGAFVASRGRRGGTTAEGRRALKREQERHKPMLDRRHETDGASDVAYGHAPWLFALYGMNMGGMYSTPMIETPSTGSGGTVDASASRPAEGGGGEFAGGDYGTGAVSGSGFDASDGGAASGVEGMFGGGESGGGFGGDWSSDGGGSGGDSGGGGDGGGGGD